MNTTLFLFLVFLNLVDIFVTFMAIRYLRCIEMNPLMKGFMNNNFGFFIVSIVKMALVLFIGFLLISENITVGLLLLNTYYIAVTINNMKVISVKNKIMWMF